MIELAMLVLVLVTVVVSEVVARRREVVGRAVAARGCRYAALGLGVIGAALTVAATVGNERMLPRVWDALIPLAVCAVPVIVARLFGRPGLIGGLVGGFVTWLAFAALFGFVVLAGMSVGLFYLPADLAILAAAILAGGGTSTQERRARTPVATFRSRG